MYALTRGSIRSGVQNGDHTRFTVTVPTPGSAFSTRSASLMISGPLGQPGEVSDMSTATSLPSTRTSYTSPRSTMFRLRSGSFTLRSASFACSRLTSAKAAPLPGVTGGGGGPPPAAPGGGGGGGGGAGGGGGGRPGGQGRG